MSIKSKILFLVGLMITLTVAAMTYIISNNAKELTRDMTYQIAEQLADSYSQQIKGILEKSMEDARILNIVFQQLKKAGSKREVLDDILLHTAQHNNHVFGAWMLWEENAYDNKDHDYVNKLGHGETGRVNSYWHWEKKSIINEVNVDWETSSWYQTPKKFGQEILEDPYLYSVSGREVLLISAIDPILINEKFMGVVGIDIKLHSLQTIVRELKILGSGYATLIANNGMYVTHPNEELIGTFIDMENSQALFNAIHSGKRYDIKSEQDVILSEPVFKITVPINIGQTNKPWGLVVIFPTNSIIAASEELGQSTLLIGSIAGFFMLALLTLFVRHIVSPITNITQKLADIIENKERIIPKLNINTNDEVGELATSFNILADDLNKSHHDLAMVNEYIIKLNVELEIRVSERTKELSETNKELLLAIQTAEAASDAKSRFLANMSHELRTPLNAILGLSELMCMDATVPEETSEKLNIINSSGEHLLVMINDVLDLSKVESGEIEFKQEAINLESLLNKLFKMMSVQAKRKKIRLIFDYVFKQDTVFLGDENKLYQVLINIVGNAIKFTAEGSVTIRCFFKKTNLYNNEMLVFEVIDTGSGISVDEIENVFKPFVQLENLTKDEAGTGLGLAISKSYIKSMGGDVYVTRSDNTGTVFQINLPITLSETEAEKNSLPSEKVISIAEGQKEFRILVVEDSAQNRLLLGTILRRVGATFKEAVNGKEAIQLFKEWSPDLIWMDMRMPIMDGYQATHEIRKLPAGDQVKIIALTASAFKEEQPKILQAGCDDLVLKPYKPQHIYSIMSRDLGVKFEYEKIQLTASDLSVLSYSQLNNLYEKVLNLNPEDISLMINEIASTHTALAQQLEYTLESLDFSSLLIVLEKMITDYDGVNNEGK